MTEPSTDQPGTGSGTRPPATPTSGAAPTTSAWVLFGAVVMVVVGIFGVIEGLVALIGPRAYYVTTNGVVVTLGLGSWAWVHLVVGALVALTGATLLSGDQPWARIVAMAIVGISILVHLVILPAAPLWSIVVIALEITVLVALARASSGRQQRT